MNIIKNLVVPAIGLSFLLGGAVAFADDGGWGSSDSSDGSTDQGTMMQLVGDTEQDQGTESTYLVGDHSENDNSANVQLVDDSDSQNNGTETDDSTWLV